MIFSVQGLPGAGKTSFLTAFLYILHKRGYKIYSNYHLKFDYTSIYEIESFLDIPFGKSIVAGDELWRELDARNSNSIVNRLLSDEVMQLRKRECHFIDTKQINRLMDVRVREITNYKIEPEIVLWYEEKPVLSKVKITNVRTNKSHNTYFKLYYDGKYMCDMYDTRELIGKRENISSDKEVNLKELAQKYRNTEYSNKSDFASYIYMEEKEAMKAKNIKFTKNDAQTIVGYINYMEPVKT